MNAWTVIIAVGAGTLMLRMSMIVAADRLRTPDWLDRASSLIAPAAFAALASTSVASTAIEAAATGAETAVAPLTAAAVGVLAVLRFGSSHAAVLAGMPTLWLLDAVLAL